MSTCTSCGATVPDGQNLCSMCYGDPEYGNDGYYKKWLDDMVMQAAYEEDEYAEYNKNLPADEEYPQ